MDWDVTSEVDDFINDGVENYEWMIRDYKYPVWQFYSHHLFYQSNANNDYPARLFVWFNPP